MDKASGQSRKHGSPSALSVGWPIMIVSRQPPSLGMEGVWIRDLFGEGWKSYYYGVVFPVGLLVGCLKLSRHSRHARLLVSIGILDYGIMRTKQFYGPFLGPL